MYRVPDLGSLVLLLGSVYSLRKWQTLKPSAAQHDYDQPIVEWPPWIMNCG